MTSAHADCDLVVSLIGAWRDGQLAETDRERFEEHLLVCPPCMDLTDNMRRALAALRAHAELTPPADLVGRMLADVGERGEA